MGVLFQITWRNGSNLVKNVKAVKNATVSTAHYREKRCPKLA